jgi:plastocyanin
MQIPSAILGLFCLLALAAHSLAQATVEGRVELPKSRVAPVVTKRYEVITKGGVVTLDPPIAVIYLEGAFPHSKAPPLAQMPQKDLMFSIPLLPVEVGTKVEFPNLDDTYHNIFSYSPAKKFDLGRYRPEERPIPSQTFDVAGLVTLHCDIHEHMRAIILVVDTPYFAKSSPDGRFRLNGLPAGKFTLKAWVNSKTTYERPVELKSGGTLEVNFP